MNPQSAIRNPQSPDSIGADYNRHPEGLPPAPPVGEVSFPAHIISAIYLPPAAMYYMDGDWIKGWYIDEVDSAGSSFFPSHTRDAGNTYIPSVVCRGTWWDGQRQASWPIPPSSATPFYVRVWAEDLTGDPKVYATHQILPVAVTAEIMSWSPATELSVKMLKSAVPVQYCSGSVNVRIGNSWDCLKGKSSWYPKPVVGDYILIAPSSHVTAGFPSQYWIDCTPRIPVDQANFTSNVPEAKENTPDTATLTMTGTARWLGSYATVSVPAAVEGDMYWDTTLNKVRQRANGAWRNLT